MVPLKPRWGGEGEERGGKRISQVIGGQLVSPAITDDVISYFVLMMM